MLLVALAVAALPALIGEAVALPLAPARTVEVESQTLLVRDGCGRGMRFSERRQACVEDFDGGPPRFEREDPEFRRGPPPPPRYGRDYREPRDDYREPPQRPMQQQQRPVQQPQRPAQQQQPVQQQQPRAVEPPPQVAQPPRPAPAPGCAPGSVFDPRVRACVPIAAMDKTLPPPVVR